MTPTRTPGRGYLTPAQLVTVDTGRNGPQALRTDAGAVWASWLAQGMPRGCLTSGYRPWGEQQGLRDDYEAGAGGMADTPERSWHPDGIAADVAEPARAWLRRWGGPAAAFDTVPGEPWHVLILAHLHRWPTIAPTITPPRKAPTMSMVPTITTLYAAYLDREPSPYEALTWAGIAASGQLDDAQLERAFMGAAPEPGTIRAAWRRFIGREADQGAVDLFIGLPSIKAVWEAVQQTPEARQRRKA